MTLLEQRRRAEIHCAWTLRKLARQYRAWASEPLPSERRKHYADEAKRLAKRSRDHFLTAIHLFA